MFHEGLNISKVLIKVLSWKPLAGGATFWVPVVGVLSPASSQTLLHHGALPMAAWLDVGPYTTAKKLENKTQPFPGVFLSGSYSCSRFFWRAGSTKVPEDSCKFALPSSRSFCTVGRFLSLNENHYLRFISFFFFSFNDFLWLFVLIIYNLRVFLLFCVCFFPYSLLKTCIKQQEQGFLLICVAESIQREVIKDFL